MVQRIFSKIRGGGIPTPAGGPRRAARDRTDATQQQTVYQSFEHPFRQHRLPDQCLGRVKRRARLAKLLFSAAGMLFFLTAGTISALQNGVGVPPPADFPVT